MSDCVIHPNKPQKRGYPKVRYAGKQMNAHRAVWIQEYGPIEDGLVVRHRCDNPRCVRLDHLELGTVSDNQRDAVERGRHAKTALDSCPQGHPYDDENTEFIRWKGRTARRCRICTKATRKRYRDRKRSAR